MCWEGRAAGKLRCWITCSRLGRRCKPVAKKSSFSFVLSGTAGGGQLFLRHPRLISLTLVFSSEKWSLKFPVHRVLIWIKSEIISNGPVECEPNCDCSRRSGQKEVSDPCFFHPLSSVSPALGVNFLFPFHSCSQNLASLGPHHGYAPLSRAFSSTRETFHTFQTFI